MSESQPTTYPWTPGPWHSHYGQVRIGERDYGDSIMTIYRGSGRPAGNAGLNFGDRPGGEPLFRNKADGEIAALAPEMAEAILLWHKGKLDNASPKLQAVAKKLRAIIEEHDA